jgi:hypothetical protein
VHARGLELKNKAIVATLVETGPPVREIDNRQRNKLNPVRGADEYVQQQQHEHTVL